MLNFCDFIQVYVFTTNHHLKGYLMLKIRMSGDSLWYKECLEICFPVNCLIYHYSNDIQGKNLSET